MRQDTQDLPQIDLYRWLEGALDPSALAELAGGGGSSDRPSPPEPAFVRPDETSFIPALKARARRIAPIPALRRVVERVLEEASGGSLRRVELVFSPAWLAAAGGYEQAAAFEAVLSASAGADSGELSIGWIAAVPAEASASELETTIALCTRHRAAGMVAVSLQLDDVTIHRVDYRQAISGAKEAGLGVVLETSAVTTAASVADALESLMPDRVVEGSRVLADLRALSAVKASRATMLTCLTGGEGRVPDLPAMIQAGLQVVLITWAPGLMGTSMEMAYQLASESFGLSRESLKGLAMAAAQSSFMDRRPKRKLERELEAELFGFPAA